MKMDFVNDRKGKFINLMVRWMMMLLMGMKIFIGENIFVTMQNGMMMKIFFESAGEKF